MDILTPYIISDIQFDETCKKYDEGIEILNRAKDNFTLNYSLKLFSRPEFRKRILNMYIRNIDRLCCDIIMINNIKRAYEKQENPNEYIELNDLLYMYNSDSIEDDESLEMYIYDMNVTQNFDSVSEKIKSVFKDTSDDSSYFDSCSLGYRMPDGSYLQLIKSKTEYDDDCFEVFMIKAVFYPIILKLEKLINSNSKEFIKMIDEYIY